MNNTEIYVDGQMVDLSPSSVIGTTFQVMSVGDITSRSVTFTNRIKLPNTKRNNQIFEQSTSENSTSRKPYNFFDVKIVQNGIEIMTGALGILRKTVGKQYEIEIYENLKSFFDLIKNKKVDEIDLEVYGRLGVFQLHKDTVSPGSPVIDYGRMTVSDEQIDNNEFDGDIFVPWENYGDEGTDWVDGTGNKISTTLLASGPNNTSKELRAAYPFRKGFSYHVVMLFNVVSGVTNGTLNVRMVGEETEWGIDLVDISSTGSKVIDKIVTTGGLNHPYIGIQATQDPLGDTKVIQLQSILIIPQHAIDIPTKYHIPVLGYKQILEKIVENAGYTWNNQLGETDMEFFERLAITFGKSEFKYTDALTDQYKFIVDADGTQTFAAPESLPHETIAFPVIVKNGENSYYNPSTNLFEVPLMPFNFTVTIHARLAVNISDLGSSVSFRFIDGGGNPYFIPGTFTIPGVVVFDEGEHVVEFSMPWVIGKTAEDFGVGALSTGGGTVEVLSGSFWIEIDKKPVDNIHLSNIILPDMSQRDFFADFLFRFGMLFKQQGKQLTTIPLRDIINDRENAVDWTSKRDTRRTKEISFIYDNYAQLNYMEDTGEFSRPGVIEIDSDQLEEEKTIYSSPFVAPEYVVVGGIRVVRVPIWDFETDDRMVVSSSFQPGPRLLYLRDPQDTDPTVEYGGVTSTDHLIAVYDDPGSPHRTEWQYFMDTYYKEFTRALNQAKVVTRYYRLTPIDIQTLDLTKLVYDDGAYYKIENIENYVPDQKSTKVTLFKVS